MPAPTQFADLSSESRLASLEVERRTGVEADPGVLALVSGRRRGRGARASPHRPRPRGRADGGRRRAASCWSSSDARGGEASKEAADRLTAAFADDPQVLLGGGAIASRQVTEAIQSDLRRAELIAFPLVLLLSFWVFRGLVAAFLPPLVGAGAIALTFLGLRIAVEVHSLSVFALNLVTGLGLGLAIDYSLFIVSRWREEAARHGHGREALARRCARAGRTVVFSALTVAASMACLLVFPQQFLYSMGLGGVLVALVGRASSPSCRCPRSSTGSARESMRWRRDRLQRLPSGGRWARLAAWVMRRPGRVAAVSASVLIVLALPALGVHFVGVDATTLPPRRAPARSPRRSTVTASAAAMRRSRRSSTARLPRRRSARLAAAAGRRGGAAGQARRTRPLAARPPPAREGALGAVAAARPHRAGRAAGGARHRADGRLRRPAGVARAPICPGRSRSSL